MFGKSARRALLEDFHTAPIRGELLGTEKLGQRASALAESQRVAPPGRALWRGRPPLLARLDATREILEDAYRRLAAAVARDIDVGPAGAWLLDNFYILELHIREVREGLPRNYYRELPVLATGHLAGYPRVYEIAATLIAHTEGRVGLDSIDLFVAAYQRHATLTLGELWALPAMLRLGLIENVRRMSVRAVDRLTEVSSADRWVARFERAGERGRTTLGRVLSNFVVHHPPFTATFVARFLQQIRSLGAAFTPLSWLEQWLAEDGMTSEEAAGQTAQGLALTQIAMANSITSLRAISEMDWRTFVEGQSAAEAILRDDPAGYYAHMTFATRDRYRHVVERLAKRTRATEEAIARQAIALARAGMVRGEGERGGDRGGGLPAASHVGFYLIDDGQAELERLTAYRTQPAERLHRWALRHPNLLYFGGIAAGTLLVLRAVTLLAGPAGPWEWWAVLALGLVPASEVAVSLVNQLVTAFLPPRTLPKLEFRRKAGIPEDCRTVVAVPTLLDSVETTRDALDHLEVQFLANRAAHLHFALLTDFADSDTETRADDQAIAAAAADGVRALNARYAGEGAESVFYLMHRPRRWNPRQSVWMGWERKRGKLAEFNRFLRGGAEHAFSIVVGDVSTIRRARYVITLDADTILAPDAAPLLAGAIAHPLNQAEYDPVRARVVRGYGIVQPRVSIALPSAFRSRFAAIHSGHPGVDPYTTAVSDTYQDLYGEGSYTGKGIYDVDVFERATRGRFPENTLLSHDLIEGNYARAALASDIEVYDEYPARYLTFMRRKHRWMRGDWQLLEWLTPRVPGPDGPERNRLSLLSRWKILDNLRRSTVEIAQILFLVAGWIGVAGHASAARWTAITVGMIAAPWAFALALAVVRPPFDKSWRAYYWAVGADARTSVAQWLLALVFLPHQAWVSADAIIRTLWRVLVTRRHLLEWRTASQVERAMTSTASNTWRAMWPVTVAAVGLAVAMLVLPGADPLRLAAAMPLVILWIASPAIARALDASPKPRERQLSAGDRAAVLRYAELHWKFFDRFVNAESNWLVPDNFQEDPEVLATRTSPTNIGLQLLATVSAHDLGFIAKGQMAERLELVFRTLERLRRFRGHFYNWYDLQDLRVLEPAYVSFVDSGNLAGHLLALRQACVAHAGATEPNDDAVSSRLEAIAERAYQYVMEMDFGFLFDRERMLFAIGYREHTHDLDGSYYDLLASESRLGSLVAIGKGDAPPEHWFRLGRTLLLTDGETALVSWSGSMFEYLMPLLVTQTYPATLLDRTYRGAVHRHISYGGEHGVPWGVSESAYNLRDRHLIYQYRAFGVPDLALRTGLGRDLVVAPYASALALMVEPHRALDNLRDLERRGALGPYGFRDALDYTRPGPGERFALVRTFMAHHVGMTLAALTNVLAGNVWQRRFHADPLVQSVELLLHERMPRRLMFQEPPASIVEEPKASPEVERPAVREIETPHTRQPVLALLGSLPYTIMVSNAGAGYSRYEQLSVHRWRADGTTDHTGQFIYIKDLARDRVWSAAHQPVCAAADWYRVLFATDRVTFLRLDGDIETRTEIAVVAGDAAEVRRVTLVNRGTEPRELELTSFGEIVLAPPNADRAHPAFGNLFVETEWHSWCSAITATRRPRSATEQRLWLVHVVDAGRPRPEEPSGQQTSAVSCETDRARFLGRGRSTADPIALEHDGPLSGTTGAVLDPIFALRVRVKLGAGESRSVSFTTLVAPTRERAFELADRYDEPHAAQRALDLAWTSAQVELRELGISPVDAAVYQELAGHLFYANPALRAPAQEVLENQGSQPLLWAHGISGDWPILLATIASAQGIPTLRQLLVAHHYWRRRGMMVDLVVLNTHPSTYMGELSDKITAELLGSSEAGVMDRPGGVFLRRGPELDQHALLMLRATARVHVECDGRPVGRILEALTPPNEEPHEELVHEVDVVEGSEPPARHPAARAPHAAPGRRTPVVVRIARRLRAAIVEAEGGEGSGRDDPPAPPLSDATRDSDPPGPGAGLALDSRPPLAFDNGIGGLAPDGHYEIRIVDGLLPPAPWANVIANAKGGFIVSERGAGCVWAENSQSFRLTPWHNDPNGDPTSEVLYLRDEESGELWAPTPAPVIARETAPYVVRHGPGITTFEHHRAGIGSHLTLGLAPDQAVKLSVLRLTNGGSRARRLTVTAFAEWTLGVSREHTQHQVHTAFDEATGAILATNTFNPDFADQVAFCVLSAPLTGHTADRREFLGRNGTVTDPAGMRSATLSGAVGAGIDPCAVLRCAVALAPNETREVVVALGAAADEARARELVDRYRDAARAGAATEATVETWRQRLSVITVRTPDPAFDAMLNGWTLYQALASRMWARTAVYQSSGAYGFRDQLQDVMAFVYAEPALAREHIVRAAGRQFVEGDVQHWWHPPSGRGIRTRFSDDLVWLPYVTDQYVRVTGDVGLLEEVVPFLTMRPLEPNEQEVYELPQVAAGGGASIYEHCRRALVRACTAGPHGIPLIQGGDWNDGMNRVGVDGRGESVWLAWFLIATLRSFTVNARARGDETTARDFDGRADAYEAAARAHAWDGAWYRRAYFDDGTPLGSAENDECRIDSIAQSWSVISGAGEPERQDLAMRSLEQYLVRDDARLVLLLTPPFDKTPHDPGYIKGYVPGVRENGAQYTHAALWAVLATAMRGNGNRAFELFQMLNPLTHARTAAEVETYKVEPYVVAADIYTARDHVGRGGWTWYTGSASWMYRVGVEAILGFTKRGDTLRIDPRVPTEWPDVTIDYRFGSSTYAITVRQPALVGRNGGNVTLDGRLLDGQEIPLRDDGQRHAVAVEPRAAR